MASPQQGPPRKPVTVIHFPKVGKSPPVHRPTVSITELKAVGRDEDATDPHVVVTPEPKPSAPKGEKAKGRRKTHDALPEAHVAHVDLKKHHSPQEAADLAALGHKMFETGKLEEARVIFEKLVGADTRDAIVHTMLGTVYLAMNAQEKALALFQAALKLDPDDLAAVTLAPATDPFVERAKRLMRMAKALGKKKSR